MSGHPLSRRAVLRSGGAVGALGTALLAGCDLDPTSSSRPAATPPPDPDQHILDAARRELTRLLRRLAATGGVASLVVAHRAQLRALDGRPPRHSAGVASLTAAQVVARESRAADRFTDWAVTCENGDLARLLASIATGIRMQPVLRGSSS